TGEDKIVWSVSVPVVLSPSIVLQRSRIQVWLYEQVNMRLEGCIIGFDEYRNLVLDDAEEIRSKPKSRKELG
ncbi:RUXE protein, partial [Haliaeetus albicilla]|nr:RUXE protein [Haliaeetus albicilla]NWZ60954.1 RUXE protein [Haliaeetus albicilla]NWZ60982.1 RUXE protein [Haliaeetus albicilla]